MNVQRPGRVKTPRPRSRQDFALDMARLGRLGFMAFAVVFHVVYIFSIFDVYFRSPIVSGMRAYGVEGTKAPAKRLVLYVGMEGQSQYIVT